MVSIEEQALIKIWYGGGKNSLRIHYKYVASQLKISNDYAYSVCTSLGLRDYVDIDRAGYCRITLKGREYIKSRGKGGGDSKDIIKSRTRGTFDREAQGEETDRVSFNIITITE